MYLYIKKYVFTTISVINLYNILFLIMVKNFFDDQDEPLRPMAASSLNNLQGKNTRKIILISIILVACVLACAYFFFNVLISPKSYNKSRSETNKQELAEITPNVYLELDPIIVNLLPSNSKQSYLKLAIILQLNSEAETKFVKTKFPIILDGTQSFLRELREADFNGTGSTLRLKEELIKRINKIADPVVIKDVLFKEMVVN